MQGMARAARRQAGTARTRRGGDQAVSMGAVGARLEQQRDLGLECLDFLLFPRLAPAEFAADHVGGAREFVRREGAAPA
jgi:hypothetical protein